MLSTSTLERLLSHTDSIYPIHNDFTPNVTIRPVQSTSNTVAYASNNSLNHLMRSIITNGSNEVCHNPLVWYEDHQHHPQNMHMIGPARSLPAEYVIIADSPSLHQFSSHIPRCSYSPNLSQLLKEDSLPAERLNTGLILKQVMPTVQLNTIRKREVISTVYTDLPNNMKFYPDDAVDPADLISTVSGVYNETDIMNRRAVFTWNIEQFSLSVSGPGETLISEPISVGNFFLTLHVAPYGKCTELRNYVSVCLIMHSERTCDNKSRSISNFNVSRLKTGASGHANGAGGHCRHKVEGTSAPAMNVATVKPHSNVSSTHSYSNTTPSQSLIPVKFRCSLLDQSGEPVHSTETEKYHLIGANMGLGFGRFVERSFLYPIDGETEKVPFFGPNDEVSLYAEIFWLEEENRPRELRIPTLIRSSTTDNLQSSKKFTLPRQKRTHPDQQQPATGHLVQINETEEKECLSEDLSKLFKLGSFTDCSIVLVNSSADEGNAVTDPNLVNIQLPTVDPHPCTCKSADGEMSCCHIENAISEDTEVVVKCHRVVLGAVSPLLSRLFQDSNEKFGVLPSQVRIFSTNFAKVSLDVCVSYLYSPKQANCKLGTLRHTELVHLLNLSKKLQIDRLSLLVEGTLITQLNQDNVCAILLQAEQLGFTRLYDHALQWIADFPTAMFQTKSYQYACDRNPKLMALLFKSLAKRRRLASGRVCGGGVGEPSSEEDRNSCTAD